MTATTATTVVPAAVRRPGRAATRAIGVLAAVVAALGAWVIGAAAGADYWLTDAQGTARVDVHATYGSTAIVALLGWGLIALLERIGRWGTTAWSVVAAAVFALSMVPVFLVEATGATRLGLSLIHIAVAAVLIPVFRDAARR